MNMSSEEICGFLVNEKRKQIWACELEMVQICLDICKKHNLKIFASGGTLLGAIRHNGFIPWDDDIDMMMPREDYEKFLDVVENEIPTCFFAQSIRTDKYYPNGHFQLRNNKTTAFIGLSYNYLKLNKNEGVWVDIFPYDYVSEDESEYQKKSKKLLNYKKLALWGMEKRPGLKMRLKNILFKLKFKSVNYYSLKIDEISRSQKESNLVGLQSFMPGYKKNVWNKEWFDEITYHEFNGISMPIPVHYDEVLKTEFNNYMELPKIKNGTVHGECFFNLLKPYSDYKNLNYNEFLDLFNKIDY